VNTFRTPRTRQPRRPAPRASRRAKQRLPRTPKIARGSLFRRTHTTIGRTQIPIAVASSIRATVVHAGRVPAIHRFQIHARRTPTPTSSSIRRMTIRRPELRRTSRSATRSSAFSRHVSPTSRMTEIRCTCALAGAASSRPPSAAPRAQQNQKSQPGGLAFCGAEGDRTPDLMTASHALSQLSYGPKWEAHH
jgi:hypothetical protein